MKTFYDVAGDGVTDLTTISSVRAVEVNEELNRAMGVKVTLEQFFQVISACTHDVDIFDLLDSFQVNSIEEMKQLYLPQRRSQERGGEGEEQEEGSYVLAVADPSLESILPELCQNLGFSFDSYQQLFKASGHENEKKEEKDKMSIFSRSFTEKKEESSSTSVETLPQQLIHFKTTLPDHDAFIWMSEEDAPTVAWTYSDLYREGFPFSLFFSLLLKKLTKKTKKKN